MVQEHFQQVGIHMLKVLTRTAYGFASHAEGTNTRTNGNYSHAEGRNTDTQGELFTC
jgi:hypothetical protein